MCETVALQWIFAKPTPSANNIIVSRIIVLLHLHVKIFLIQLKKSD